MDFSPEDIVPIDAAMEKLATPSKKMRKMIQSETEDVLAGKDGGKLTHTDKEFEVKQSHDKI